MVLLYIAVTIRINLRFGSLLDMQSWPPRCHEDSHRSPHRKVPFTVELQQQRDVLKHGMLSRAVQKP